MTPIEQKIHILHYQGIPVGHAEEKEKKISAQSSKQRFEYVSVYHTADKNATFEVGGFIREQYERLGAEEGALGLPTSDTEKDPEVKRGQFQRFEGGWISWTPAKGVAYYISEEIGERGLGEATDALTKFPKEADFFQKYYQFALQSEQTTRIPALFTLAQSALETGWGKKAPANNMFGVKADKNWKGKKVLVDTDEYFTTSDMPFPEIMSIEWVPALGKYKYRVKDWFRAYDAPSDSFNDRAQFLLRKRYEKAFLYVGNPYKFAQEVALAGYATAPNYYAILSSIIAKLDSIKTALQNKMLYAGGTNFDDLA